jgi:hypothetical protein
VTKTWFLKIQNHKTFEENNRYLMNTLLIISKLFLASPSQHPWPSRALFFPLPGINSEAEIGLQVDKGWKTQLHVTGGPFQLHCLPLFPFDVTGVWSLVLARWAFNHLRHTPNTFRYFSNRLLHLCPGCPGLPSSYLCFLHSWDDRNTLSHSAGYLLVEMGSCEYFSRAGLRPLMPGCLP